MDLSFMDIHTTTDQIVWGNLNPQIYYKSIPAIKELNETTATIVQEYLISAQSEEGYTELYTVNEYFRLRYADESVMLLDFERSTNEIFNPDNGVLTDKGIRLGICDSDISFVTDSKSRFYAFEIGGELWSYDSSSGKMAQVFTLRQKGSTDYRDIYGQHDIKIFKGKYERQHPVCGGGLHEPRTSRGRVGRGSLFLRRFLRRYRGNAVCGYHALLRSSEGGCAGNFLCGG